MIDYGTLEAGQRYLVVDGRAVKRKPQILEGFCCLYNVEHPYKDRTEVFLPGCFDGSLFEVFFAIDHHLLGKKLGDQNDGTLQLCDSDIGLAFRWNLTPENLERLEGRDEMSPSYIEHEVEFRKGIRVIKRASLLEISAVTVGAIRKTFSVVRDADSVRSLSEEVKTSFATEAASIAFLRALRRL